MSNLRPPSVDLQKKPKPAIERGSTGIEGLDELIDGGIPTHSGIMLAGPTGCGKSVFCKQFIWEGLKKGEIGVYIAYDHAPDHVRDSMMSFGWNITPYEEEGKFAIIDAFNGSLGIENEEKYYLKNPFDTNEFVYLADKVVNAKVNSFGSQIRVRVAMDSGSPFTTMMKLPSLLKVGRRIYSYVKKYNVFGLHVMHSGAQNKIVETLMRQMVDGSIEFDKQIEHGVMKYYIWVSRMPMTKHSKEIYEYMIDENGMRLIGPRVPGK